MSRKIHLVQGEHGEYDDYTTWIVCAFRQKEDAERYASAMNVARAKAYEAIPTLWLTLDELKDIPEFVALCALDKHVQERSYLIDVTRYSVVEVEMKQPPKEGK